MLVADPAAKISPLADIEPSVRGSKVVVAAGAVIDAFVKVKPAGGSGDVTIGPGSVINSGCVLYTGNGIAIGADVLIAANCTLAPTNHEFRDPGRPIRTQGFMESRGGIVIEDDVWIGANSVILDGAIIRKGSIIAAGSVVRDERPAYSISAGAPAKTIGWRK